MLSLKSGLPFVSREQWGAAKWTEQPQWHLPKRIVVHHSFVPNSSEFSGEESIRAIQRYHQDQNKWADIAYHYLISPDGSKIYEGRSSCSIGAHCGGITPPGRKRIFGNTGSIGICCIGDYDHETPLESMMETLIKFIEWLENQHHIKPSEVYGHFEAWSKPPKTCPGKNLALELFGKNRWEKAFGKS